MRSHNLQLACEQPLTSLQMRQLRLFERYLDYNSGEKYQKTGHTGLTNRQSDSPIDIRCDFNTEKQIFPEF